MLCELRTVVDEDVCDLNTASDDGKEEGRAPVDADLRKLFEADDGVP